ncbi:PilW family protein [Pseudomonas sp. FME51]|uniref:PilW family protein n=1 Tax=Pseudomonas sp. FME51 TaxID=2742609 RepID=UPI00186674BE|nr:PilW family protein [Pseudomonas sp. FME51]
MKRSQFGFTLIELMVAMLIGLILTLAALQLFLTNQRTFALQQAVAELHEDGQQAIRYMVADLRQAGRGSAIAGAIPPIDLVNSSNGTNDTLAIHYWGTSTCAGDIYLTENEIHNVYSVNNQVLQCRSVLTNITVDLVSGVESFQVLYGVDSDKDGELGVTQFVTANNLTADSVVVAIRFALLLSSGRFRQSQSASTTHWVLDQKVDTSDSDLRRVFNSTVQLRNYNWEGV